MLVMHMFVQASNKIGEINGAINFGEEQIQMGNLTVTKTMVKISTNNPQLSHHLINKQHHPNKTQSIK